jgi:predicted ATPase/class 3 adenylate cyclase
VGERPSGTVTFLFTDIEGSTQLWEAHGDDMASTLAQHDALLRAAIEGEGGFVFAGGGDGVAAAFASAAGALTAARNAQRSLRTAEWGATGAVGVRMGLHTGIADERDGDYFGPTLNRTARLMAIGHGGQVLLSQATAAMVDRFRLLDLGEHRLRDLSEPEHVFQLIDAELDTEFPALRSLSAYRGNLPLQLTSFIGRDDELRAVTDALHDQRLVTLIGVGGVGKTRLSVHAAAELVADFPDGVWQCELAAVTDDDGVCALVGGVLNVPLTPGRRLTDGIVDFLRSKRLLLLLDNCEHVLDGAGELADAVLRACADVRILATGREPLAVHGEHISPVRSLAVDSDAVNLFTDRARAARANFVIDRNNSAAVEEICRRLDGIPLAIELAAARVVSLSPTEIASLLDERFRLLTGGRRVSLERHQTMRAAVDWSYALLSDQERTVFERIAVFSSFDADGAQAVVTDEAVDRWAVLDAIDGLVRKSMLVAGEQREGVTRYQLLETLRQFASERLSERSELDRWRVRHAEYFADFAERIGPALLGADEFVWRSQLILELDNLRAAMEWSLSTDQEHESLAVRIMAHLTEDHGLSARTLLGLGDPRAVVDAARRGPPGLRAAVLAAASYMEHMAGDALAARALATEAISLGLPDDCPSPYRVYWSFTDPTWGTDTAKGIPMLQDAERELERRAAPVAERARLKSLIAQAATNAGLNDLADDYSRRAYELARQSQNPSTLVQALYHLGAYLAGFDSDGAETAFTESIALSARGTTDSVISPAYYQRGLLRARRGESVAAVRDLRDGIQSAAELGHSLQLIGAFGYAIELLTVVGALEPAAVIIGAARSGALISLREMAPPPDRRQHNSAPIRERLDRERFNALAAQGATLSLEELRVWLTATLNDLISAG